MIPGFLTDKDGVWCVQNSRDSAFGGEESPAVQAQVATVQVHVNDCKCTLQYII